MARVNNKKQLFDYENSIKKSNKLSMGKLAHGLTLNQMQLLAFAIYYTQKNGKTEFNKVDFERQFNLDTYKTAYAREDTAILSRLQFSVTDLENDSFEFWNVFQGIKYKEGLFTFKWSEDMIPHILELREKYVMTDLTITARFKSSFSWTLYDYLRAHYGYWHKPISKNTLMKLFGVESVKSYQKNTGLLKKKVLDVAIAEINEHTELEVWYKEEKKGRSIVGFDIHWSSGKKVKSATKKQIQELKTILDVVDEDVFEFINLKNDKDRESAIDIVRKVEGMKIYTGDPICITYETANELLLQATDCLRMLVTMQEKENSERDTSFYYNWLEG